MSKTKTHGWIRQANNTGWFVISNGDETRKLRDAHVFDTRKEARHSKLPYRLPRIDIVRKVGLSKTGKAKCILGVSNPSRTAE